MGSAALTPWQRPGLAVNGWVWLKLQKALDGAIRLDEH